MKFIRRFKESSLHKAMGLELGTFREVELDAGKGEQHCRGFYLHFNGMRIGIVATDEGPVFLCNEDKYLLDKHTAHFLLRKNSEINTFIFMWEGDVKLQISYLRSLIKYDEKWVDDSIFDFFSWLYEASGKRKFYAYYTVKNVSATELYPYESLHRSGHTLATLPAYA
ncbi:hypothetical protein AMS62_17485 [Bacillus sp. FJAT-18019]|uniref:Uncharacterized protein n=1 Tax=Paenibacillus solani TaxID=1705565 RepID=A0A0M1NJU7_9BACL|nr:hypothetical protein [Paenibacillus solani]KOP66828.1 hypothetical protein AMS62_17485 [Bacillus sp. FJAT-18019]KOR82362.1 hypothetical protein AM231_18695 [Paenibacillus solani]